MGLRIAVVGLGSFGAKHIKTIERLGLGKVTAVVSRKKSNRIVPDAAVYETASALFENETPDALIITVPPCAHGEAELLAAEHSVPFFVEKPVSDDESTALRILESVERSGIITSVGYHSRYSPAIAKAREITIESKSTTLHGYWIDSIPPSLWWKREEISGGQVIEQATHIVDIFRYLLGEPIDVYSRGRKGIMSVDFESTSETVMTFPEGIIAALSVSCEKTKGSKIGFTLGFADGAAEYKWNGKLSIRSSKGTITAGPENPAEMYDKELIEFFRAVETGDRSGIRSDYKDAVRTLYATLAIKESMKKRKPIKVKDLT